VAGAGAGKTKTITHRIAHLMARGIAPNRILAVTFTNKAAGEMRDRIRGLLTEGSAMPTVVTFHSLGVRLLREFHAEAGVERAFAIWDRDDSIKAIKRIQESLGEASTPARAVISAISREKGNTVTAREFEAGAKDFRQRSLSRLWHEYEKTQKITANTGRPPQPILSHHNR
jgi:DNA helicase II / ATP-dependent DNA helicase PcrA